MSLIRELALGNLQPLARSFESDSEYAQILTAVTTHQEELLKSLSPEQKELYDAFNESTIDLSSVNDQDVFTKGFVLGAQLMMEILTADPMDDAVR